jgi:hypothetical protein
MQLNSDHWKAKGVEVHRFDCPFETLNPQLRRLEHLRRRRSRKGIRYRGRGRQTVK